MELLTIIDQMTWVEFLIFFSVFLAITNFVAWIWLMRRQELSKRLKNVAERLLKNERGFVDPFFFMACAAFLAGISLFHAKVTPKKPECVRETRIIQYLDHEEKKQIKKPVKKKPVKTCEVQK